MSKPEPATLTHARAVFGYLADNAKIEKIAVPMVSDEAEFLVYRGRMGKAYEAAGVSKSYYSKVRAFLLATEAINILVTGSVHGASVVVLDPDALERFVNSSADSLTIPAPADKLEHRVKVLENGLGGINVLEALRNLELRVLRLEGLLAGESEVPKN